MVEHDEKTKSFYLLEDGYKAFICYDVQNGEFDVLTTQVPKAISGRGLASQLMKDCASFVKEKVLPQFCWKHWKEYNNIHQCFSI